jgi:hypothetical protein
MGVVGSRGWLGALGGVLVLALLYSGVGYFTGSVPFPLRHRGDLLARELCEEMGADVRAAAELRGVLPARSEYSSSGESPPRMHDDHSWRANCIVSGDGDQLLYTSAELGWDASATTWLDDPTRNYVDDEGKGDQFRAGSAAVVMEHTAQVLVPCVPRKGTWPYHLVVEVHASKPLAGSVEENRHALATVALGTGRSAHQEAECTLSAKIPATVAWLD